MAYFYFIVLFICMQTCMPQCMEVRRQLWELFPSTLWVPSFELKLFFLLISTLPTEPSQAGIGFMILVS